MLTVHTAEAADIWPDGSGLSAEAEREIIAIARNEISADDVARSGLVFSEWYKYFHLAEGRWRQRQAQQAEQKQRAADNESANARRIARLERRLFETAKNVNLIYETLLSKPKDDPDGELRLFKLIKNIAWEQIVDRKVMRDAGVWRSEKCYGAGATTTHDGQLWVAQQESTGVEPGEGVCWRLTHKSDLSEVRGFVRTAVRDELYKQKGKQS